MKRKDDQDMWPQWAKDFGRFFETYKFPEENCYFISTEYDGSALAVCLTMLDPEESANCDSILDYTLVEFEIDQAAKTITADMKEPYPQTSEEIYSTNIKACEFMNKQIMMCL